MKILRMLRYLFINIVLIGITVSAFGQQKNETSLIDSKEFTPIGFTLGVNLATPLNSFFDNSRTGVSFFTRINLFDDWFFNGEVGYENVSSNTDVLNYQSNGTFLKVGGEKNILSKKKSLTDNIFLGFQYGVAVQDQKASSILIENGYWGDYMGSVNSEVVHTHWLEFSAGPRVELLRNIYFGWKVHIRAAVYKGGQDMLKPYAVPGYGNGDRKVNGGLSYTIEYMIPWKKKI